MLHLTRVNEGLHTSFKNRSWLRSGDVTIYYDDQISLNQALQSQEIDTQWFLPFTLYRLQSYTSLREALINVSLRHIYNEPLITRRLSLTWSADTPVLASPPVQDAIITEWAACGIACAILPFYTPLHLVKVTESGDRFDYWVGDGTQLFGLEVSGILHGPMMQRQQTKVRQLLANPFGIGGYVCIVHFGNQSVDLSFHLPTGRL